MSSKRPSALGAHLAEMDKLLRDIQAELMPEREPAPVLAGVAGTPPSVDPPGARDAQLQALAELSTRLLASMRELLAGYERVLVRPSSRRPPPRRAPAQPRWQTDEENVTVSAGPFRSVDALREFGQAVSRLPGVREVAVQGYEGSDRAIIEVRLEPSQYP